jgi:hypothetical protein
MVVRHPRRTRFACWVAEVTVGGTLERLRVEGVVLTNKAVYHWLAGRSAPPLTTAAALVRASEGRVTLDDIVQHRTEAASGASRESSVASAATERHRGE